MMNFTRLRVMLLMVSGFTVGMGSVGVFGGSVALAYSVTVRHVIYATDEEKSPDYREYKRDTQELQKGDEMKSLPELKNFTATPFPIKGPQIQTLVYSGVKTRAYVHLKFVTGDGVIIFERDSKPELTVGGRMSFDVPTGYELVNIMDMNRIALQPMESWNVRVKATSTENSGGQVGGSGASGGSEPQTPGLEPEPKPEPKPNPEPDKPAKQPNTGGDKDVVAIPKPPAPSKPQTKPSTPQAPTPHPRPVQVPTITHPIGQPALAAVSRPGKKPVPTLTTAPNTSTLPQLQVVNHPLSHQGAADWWRPVTATVKPDKPAKRPTQQTHQSQTAHRRPAANPATSARQPGHIAKPAQSAKTSQLPQTDEQTLPLAWYGASILLGLTGLTGYRRIRR